MFEVLIKNIFKTECLKEFRFHDKRRWRSDYALPEYKIMVEVEGGIFIKGRHTTGVGFVKDMEKYNTATSMGWSVLRVQPKELLSTSTIDFIKNTIESKCQLKLN